MSRAIVTLLVFLISTGVYARQDWKLKKEEDGIKVFAASQPNSDFKAIRVECTVNARMPQLVAFLLDIEKQHDWVYYNKTARLIKKVSDNELISYSEYSVPWPCSNRDYISHITFNQQTPQVMTIDSKAEPELLPVKEGKVRVKNSTAHWEVTKLSNDLLKIIYTAECDPAGSMPAWLTNMFVAKGPYQTFQKLRTCVKEPQYLNAHFDFLKE